MTGLALEPVITNPEKTERVGLMLKNVISDQTTRKDMAAVRQAANLAPTLKNIIFLRLSQKMLTDC